MTPTTLYEAAMIGTFEEFMEWYHPGATTKSGEPLLSAAILNRPPARAQISNFLLDEGEDPAWCDPSDGLTYLHVLFGGMPNAPFPQDDLALVARLLDGGADINAVKAGSGTPLQVLIKRVVTYKETHADPLYDLIFARDDLKLFEPNARGNSTYRIAWKCRSSLPKMWERVQRYVAEHGLTVPDGETDEH